MIKKVYAVLSIFILQNGFVLGADLTPTQEYLQQQIVQRQEQERQYKEKIRNIVETQRVKEANLKEISVPRTPQAPEGSEIKGVRSAYSFDKIILTGNKTFSYGKLKKAVLNKFINKPINKQNVSLLQSELLDFYIKRGYVLTKIYFDPSQIKSVQNEISGKDETLFPVIIEEGLTSQILLKNLSKKQDDKPLSKLAVFRQKSRLFFAFPFKTNKVFNIKDFEQGLEQMNKLQSNNISMEIAPSQNENLAVSASDIIIINNQNPLQSGVSGATRTTFLNLNFNNGGSKSTGANILNLSLSQDNLLAVNDNIYISYSENADSLFNTDKKDKNLSYGLSRDYPAFDFFNNDGGKKKFSKSLYSSFSFPFGFWSFSAALSYSTYKSSVEGEIAKFHLTGQSLAQTYSADRVILRSKIYRLNLGASLELKDSQSYIRDALSQTASARRNSAALYLNNVLYTKFGTLIFKPSYHKGLGLFGAKTDSRAHSGFDMVDSDPKLQYNLLKFYLYFNAPINIPLLTKNQERQERNTLPLFYNLTIDSQYSFDALYGNEQFSAGGQYSVRGFKESVISGDNGFYMRNDLRVSLLNIFPDILKETSVFKRKRAFLFEESPQTVLSKTQFSLFYDLGYVANKYRTVYDAIYDSQSGFMSGCGISLSYYGRYLNFSLTYSKALSSPEYLQARDGINKEDSSLYWKIGASW